MHIATNIILKVDYIMGCNLFNVANMALCHQSLCVSCVCAFVRMCVCVYTSVKIYCNSGTVDKHSSLMNIWFGRLIKDCQRYFHYALLK